MSNYRVGDVIQDCNSTWERFRETGTVVSVRRNKVTWRSHTDNKLVVDHIDDMVRVKTTNNNLNRRSNMRSFGNKGPKGSGAHPPGHNNPHGRVHVRNTIHGTTVMGSGKNSRGVGHAQTLGRVKTHVKGKGGFSGRRGGFRARPLGSRFSQVGNARRIPGRPRRPRMRKTYR